MGGRIIGAQVLAVRTNFFGTFEVRVQELHSTKGWKTPTWVSARRFGWNPVIGRFSWSAGCGPHRHTIGTDAVNLVSEKALMRHGWYRRKKRQEAAHANL